MSALTHSVLLALLLVTPARADDAAKQAAAESAFDQIMLGNSMAPAAVAMPPAPSPELALISPSGSVDVPLDRYEAVRERVRAAAAQEDAPYRSLVALGSSAYEGRATPRGLELRVRLDVTLRGAEQWKTVPIVGEDVAVVRATAGGKPIALTTQAGYQVWVTDAVGELSVEVELLVPATGPKGSLEYDFLVPRTPVTRFDCAFPELGIEPRLSGAVQETLTESGDSTRLSAWLSPTSRVHLVGFRDFGDEDATAARIYAETSSLLSVEARSVELFSVLRYSILEAGTRQFDIQVPPGFSVVSADGAGAFRYALETTAGGTIVHGETAFPIRDRYEVSLRLSKSVGEGVLEVSPPHAIGAERELGWMGLEAIGTIQVEEVGTESVVDIGVAQLPAELVQNAVSPVVEGWRYHQAGATVRLNVGQLPELEPAAGAIDRVRATTRIAPHGGLRTTLAVTLRNRLRHSLAMRLPEGMTLRACRLDGVPVVASTTAEGKLLLPLRRSAGSDRPVPFTLEVELDSEGSALGLVGFRNLQLPQFELPVSTVEWSVEAPAANRYTALAGDLARQDAAAATDTTQGAVTTLAYTRYWVEAERPIGVAFGFVRGWVRGPLALLAVGAVVAGAMRLGLVGRSRRRLAEAWSSLRTPAASEAVPYSWREMGLAGRGVLLVTTGAAGLLSVVAAVRLLYLLANPLAS